MKVKFIQENLIFNEKDEVYAAYQIDGMQYNFLENQDKLNKLMAVGNIVENDTFKRIQLLKITEPRAIKFLPHNRSKFPEVLQELEKGELELISDFSVKGTTQNSFFVLVRIEQEYLLSLKQNINDIKKKIIDVVDFDGKNASEATDKVYRDFHHINKKYFSLFQAYEKEIYATLSGLGYYRSTELELINAFRHISCLEGLGNYRTSLFEDDESYYIPQNMATDFIKNKGDAFRFNYLEFVSEEGDKKFVSYYTLSVFEPEQTAPGSEFLYWLEMLPINVDYSVTSNILNNDEAVKKIGKKKAMIFDQINQNNEANTQDNKVLADGRIIETMHDEMTANKRSVMLESKVIVRIESSSKQEFKESKKIFKQHMNQIGVMIQNPMMDQYALHQEFFPGAGAVTRDYVQYSNADFITGAGHALEDKIGNREGFFLGYSLKTNSPVFLDPSRPAQSLDSGAVSAPGIKIVGLTGSGKSVLANYIAFKAGMYGAKVVILDLKNERWRWKKHLGFVEDEISIITIGDDTGGRKNKDRGTLDPFLLEEDSKRAVEIAQTTLQQILKLEIGGVESTVLKKALRVISQDHNPGLNKLSEVLKKIASGNIRMSDDQDDMNDVFRNEERYRDAAYDLRINVDQLTENTLTRLLFSNGDKTEITHISYDKTYTMLQFAGLQLPTKEMNPANYTEDNLISVAIMNLIQLFTKTFMYSDESTFKMIVNEEAWSLTGNETGSGMVDDSFRLGRSTNTAPIVVTQNETDGISRLNNNIGTFFYGQTTDLGEVKAIARTLNMDEEEARRILANLNSGEWLMKDVYGNIDVIYNAIPFKDMQQAFDTSTKGFGLEESL